MQRYGTSYNDVVGFILDDLDKGYKRRLDLHAQRDAAEPDLSLTEYCVSRLGKPDQHVWTGRGRSDWTGGSERRRCLVWHRDPLYLLVHNEKGICIESLPGQRPERVLEAQEALYSDLMGDARGAS